MYYNAKGYDKPRKGSRCARLVVFACAVPFGKHQTRFFGFKRRTFSVPRKRALGPSPAPLPSRPDNTLATRHRTPYVTRSTSPLTQF